MKAHRAILLASVLALAIPLAASLSAADEPGSESPTVEIVRPETPAPVQAARAAYVEGRPQVRGFRAPILDRQTEAWPITQPSSAAAPQLREAATLVGQRLAVDGLLLTTAKAIELLGQTSTQNLDAMLRQAGVPTDLLGCFSNAAGQPVTVESLAQQLTGGQTAAALAPVLAQANFSWTPTRPGYIIQTECGQHDLAMLRVQATRGDDWQAPGDGGSLDIIRQFATLLPDVDLTVSIESRHLDQFFAQAQSWLSATPASSRRIVVIEETLRVTQWAQDNGKPGLITDTADGRPRWFTLTPRFASRGEDGSSFVPGDSFLMDGLAAAGLDIGQSPLLFQAGNLLACRDPKGAGTLLLIGEAEIDRNVALGLTPEQAAQAFQAEFGADRVVVLPAVSFHIDYELSIRSQDGRVLALVNDPAPAIKLILWCGVGALERSGAITPAIAYAARESLRADRPAELLNTIGGTVLSNSSQTFGQFPEAFAKVFSTGPGDSHVGNFRLMLLALDMTAASIIGPDELPPQAHAQAYLLSFQRDAADRAALHAMLEREGFTLVRIPSISNESRSLTYINGIHDRTRYLMPAWGGLYKPVDEAAVTVLQAALGPNVRIVPILSAESQRRVGAVHCAASAYYRPPAP